MAVRNDIIINWAVSPRIATIAAPSVRANIQDIVDTFRTLESEMGALDDDFLMDASGKDFLDEEEGIEKRVGITLKLLNTRIAFEARPAPNFIQCSISGGNLTAKDINGNVMNPIEPTAYTQVAYEKSSSPTMVISGSGVTEQDKIDIRDKILDAKISEHQEDDSLGEHIADIKQQEVTNAGLIIASGD